MSKIICSDNVLRLNPTDSRIDILKFVMAIMVIAIHTDFYHSITMPWLRIAVPEFFILSSFFFFKKLNKAHSQADKKKHLIQFILRNVKLYLCWLVILLVPTLYLRIGWFQNGIFYGTLIFIKNMIFGSTFVASWFISANVLATIIVFYLRRYIGVLIFGGVIFYALQCIRTNYFNAFPLVSNYIESLSPSNPLNLFEGIFSAMIWCVMGYICFKYFQKPNSILYLVLLVCGCICLHYEDLIITNEGFRVPFGANDNYFSLLILCPSLFLFVRSLPSVYFPFSIILRHASVIFFFVHGTVAFLPIYLKLPIFDSWNRGLASFTATLFICVIITVVILYFSKKGIKWFRYLY